MADRATKWEGLFGIIGDKIGLSENAVASLFAGSFMLAIIGVFWRPFRRTGLQAS